jgi:hypothetical protein
VTGLRGWTAEESAFDFRRGQEIVLFSVTFTLAVGSAQSSIEWIPGDFSPGLKRPRRHTGHRFHQC